ncbi:MAG: hypothetical protein AB1414_14275 [bacterium]
MTAIEEEVDWNLLLHLASWHKVVLVFYRNLRENCLKVVVQNNQLAFAEGRDVLENSPGKASGERFSEITNLAETKPEKLASLSGNFGFIRFRPGGGATVIHSCGGFMPFYLGRFGSCFAISTRPGDFVRYLHFFALR